MASQFSAAIVLVAFNEQPIIGDCLTNLVSQLEKVPLKTLVLAVNNGSTDETGQEIDRFIAKTRTESEIQNVSVVKLDLEQNLRLAGGFRRGIQEIEADWVMLYSADMFFEAEAFIRYFTAAGLIYGSSVSSDLAAVVGIRKNRPGYPLHLRLLSSAYNSTLRLLFRVNVRDLGWSCLYRTTALKSANYKSNSIFFLPEILVRLSRNGGKFVEIPSPVQKRTSGAGTVSKPSTWAAAISDIAKFTTESLFGG